MSKTSRPLEYFEKLYNKNGYEFCYFVKYIEYFTKDTIKYENMMDIISDFISVNNYWEIFDEDEIGNKLLPENFDESKYWTDGDEYISHENAKLIYSKLVEIHHFPTILPDGSEIIINTFSDLLDVLCKSNPLWLLEFKGNQHYTNNKIDECNPSYDYFINKAELEDIRLYLIELNISLKDD